MKQKNNFLLFFMVIILFNCNNDFVVNAILPTTIASINSTNGFKISQPANARFAHGDFNGDGHDDLISWVLNVGIYVYYGPLKDNFQYEATPSMIDGTNGFIYSSNYVYFNELAIGDINNDGFDDIAFYHNYLNGEAGVIYGTNQTFSPPSFSTLNGVNGFYLFYQSATKVAFGYCRSIIDFNGDGIKDLYVTTSVGAFARGTPMSYMLFGINGGKFPVDPTTARFNESTFNGSNGFIINGLSPINAYPYDMNNDGIGDIMVNIAQTAIYVIYGRRGTFTSPYIPVYDGIQGNVFSLNGFSINNNLYYFGYGDFNQDGLNDFAIPVFNTSKYLLLILYGKTQYPATTILSTDIDKSDGLIVTDSRTNPSPNPWALSKLADINNDGAADLLMVGAIGIPFSIIFGSNIKYPNITIYLNEMPQFGSCYYSTFSDYTSSFVDFGDYNSDGINDITGGGTITVYGSSYIGSITIINLVFPFNTLSNLIYKIFENNINSVDGLCAITKVTLTIDNSINGDQFIIDNSYDNSIYSITPNSNNTKLTIELLIRDQSKSIANDVLNKISVSLTPQLSNRTVTMKYGSNVLQSITIIGAPNCQGKCLNGGTCVDLYRCQCINDYYGDSCEIKDCTVNCLNGGSCNTTIGSCSCIDGFYGNDCGTKDCTVNCLNGGSCNTTIGECSCIDDFYGNDCGTKDCTVNCLNGGSCNTTIGECYCIDDFYGNDCGTKDCTVNCLNGGSCDKSIGECSCPQDYEGIDCSGISCSSTCLNGGTCNTTIGSCLCSQGYESLDCSGISCSATCLNEGICDITIGECSCTDDYEGDDCSNKKSSKRNIGVIIGPILGGLALIAIIVAAVILIKKKKNSNNNQKPNNIELKTQASTVGVFYGGQINNLDKF